MTIANGQTMVIGGLIQEKNDDNLSSLPLINKIPILNRLFGNTSANVERTEILMLITGYIVNEHSPVEEMIKRYNDAIKAINDFDSKLGDRPNAEKKAKPAVMTKKEFWL
jgi:general secretion pathway protein D